MKNKEHKVVCAACGKDDEEIVYTKEVLDRALRTARGTILPFDERYDVKRLYFRDRREEWKDETNDSM